MADRYRYGVLGRFLRSFRKARRTRAVPTVVIHPLSNPDFSSGIVSLGGSGAVVSQGGVTTVVPGGGQGGTGGHGWHGHRPWRTRGLWYWGYPYHLVYNCQSPLSSDCRGLSITRPWATYCFASAYQQARIALGYDADLIAQAILEREAEGCMEADTSAAAELTYRVRLAVALLLRSEGVAAPIPEAPGGIARQPQRSPDSPWMRALLTGA